MKKQICFFLFLEKINRNSSWEILFYSKKKKKKKQKADCYVFFNETKKKKKTMYLSFNETKYDLKKKKK